MRLPPILVTFARLVGAGLLVLAASAAVVWPLWALATGERRIYNAMVGIALALLVAWRLASRLRRARLARRPSLREKPE